MTPTRRAATDYLDASSRAIDAIREGDAEALRELLASGVDPDIAGPAGEPLLALAAAANQADCVRALLPFSSPAATDEHGRDALMQAAISGAAECVGILASFCDASRRDAGGRTALMLTAIARPPRALECAQLLASHSDLNARDHDGFNALSHSFRDANPVLGLVRFLAPISDARTPASEFLRMTPLMDAVLIGNVDIVRALAPFSDLSAQISQGNTALALAIGTGRSDIAGELLPRCSPAVREAAFQKALSKALLSGSLGGAANSEFACLDLFAPFLSEEQIGHTVYRLKLMIDAEMDDFPALFGRREALAQRDSLQEAAFPEFEADGSSPAGDAPRAARKTRL